MPIKAKNNGSYKDVTELMNVDESIDYVLAKTSSSYKRVYTATRSIEDTPPTTFKSIKPGANLTDYRIYGQTSRNLFDAEIVQGSFNNSTGALTVVPNRVRSNGNAFIFLKSGTYTINASGVHDVVVYCYSNNDVSTFVKSASEISWRNLPYRFTANADYYYLFAFRNATNSTIIPSDISNIMLNSGSTPLPYEPYGESVGDRTGNLFDGSFIHRSVIQVTVSADSPNRRSIVVDISNFNNGDKITFSRETSAGNMFQMYQVTSPLEGGELLNDNVITSNSETLLATITLDNISKYPYLMIFLNGVSQPITDEELRASKIMVNAGNTPLPYEPYGYKVPVTVEGKNLSEVNEFSNSITDTAKTLNIWVQQGKGQSFAYPDQSNIFVIAEPTTITSHITITDDNDSIRIKHNGYTRDIVIDIVHGLSYGVYSVSFNVLDHDLTTVGGIVINNIMVNKGSIALPVTTNLYLPEQIRKVVDEAEYVDYAEQKQHRVRVNYLQTSNFEAGAIYTGELFLNRPYQNSKTEPGALNYDSTRKRSTNLITISGTYTISIADGWEFGIVMFPNGLNSGEIFKYTTEPVTISNCTFAIQIRKRDVSDVSSADISDYKIMLNKGSTALPYEPYIENTEVDVTLPALPTLPGTNVLSVGTEVQPSKIDITGHIKTISGGS